MISGVQRLLERYRQIRRFTSAGRPQWALASIVPITIIVGAVLSAVPPLLVGRIVDSLHAKNFPATFTTLLEYCATLLAQSLMVLVSNLVNGRVRETFARNVQIELLQTVQRADVEEVAKLSVGQLLARISGDVRVLISQIESSIAPLLSSVLGLCATVIIMVRLDVRLTVISFAFAVLPLFPVALTKRLFQTLQRQITAVNDHLFTLLSEYLTFPGLVNGKNAVATEKRRLQAQGILADGLRLRLRSIGLGSGVSFATGLISMVGPALVLLFGARWASDGTVSVGTIISILIYQSRLAAPLTALSQLPLTLATLGVALDRLLEVLDLHREQCGTLGFRPGDIVVEEVTFERNANTILDRISLRIKQGQHIALVGESGSGKSTLCAILARLYKPDSGIVTLGAAALDDFDLDELRAFVCIVPQDAFIMDATLRENIELNREIVAPDELSNVLALLRLNEVCRRIGGVDQRIGERGARLSGGERQRVSIARAVLQRPEVLILDEPLTGVDSTMEREILDDLQREFDGRTLIIVTHRPNIARRCDMVISMSEGRVVSVNTTDALSVRAHLAAGRDE